MERYALYLRKSRADKDAERAENTRDTLARHRAILLELAESKGISGEKIDVYEEVVSGDSISARPQIKKLIAAAEKHIYAGVLCMDIDRLARGDTVDQGIIARTFRLSNTLIITPKKIYDPSSEFDEEYFEFELFMARREFRMIGQRIQRGRVRSAGEGRFIGSKAPFGYDKVKLKNDKGYTLVENSDEETVRLIFKLYLSGERKAAVADRLNALGIKPPKSEKWSASSVSNILNNPAYAGKIRWGHRKCVKELEKGEIKTCRKTNENCVLADGLHKSIITQEDFEKAQLKSKRRTHQTEFTGRKMKNPLSGLIYCGICGKPLTRLGENPRCRFETLRCPDKECPTVSSKLYLIENAIVKALNAYFPEIDIVSVYQISDPEQKNRLLKAVIKRITYTKTERCTRRNTEDANFIITIITYC